MAGFDIRVFEPSVSVTMTFVRLFVLMWQYIISMKSCLRCSQQKELIYFENLNWFNGEGLYSLSGVNVANWW